MESCSYIYAKGKQKGQRCTVIPHKGKSYCCNHKGSEQAKYGKPRNDVIEHKKDMNAECLAEDEVFSGENTVRAANSTPKSSVWAITVNSNKSLDDLTTDQKKDFRDICNYLFRGETHVLEFVSDRGQRDTRELIDNVESEMYFETSSSDKGGRLHAHCYLRIEHHGNLILRANDLREFYRKTLGYTIHLHCPVSSDQVSQWRAYISKGANKVDL